MYCGTDDFISGISDQTADHLKQGHADPVYKKGPGAHSRVFRNEWLPVFFEDCGLTKLLK